jgi:hypothetical protein
MNGQPMAPQGAPQAAPGGEDPMMAELEGALAQYAQSRDPQLAVQICDALVEASGGGGGDPMAQGGGAPPMDPMGGDPMGGAPMGRYGMQMPGYYQAGGKVAVKRTFKKI